MKDQYADNFVYRKKAELSTCGDTESIWQVPLGEDATNSGMGIGQRGGTETRIVAGHLWGPHVFRAIGAQWREGGMEGGKAFWRKGAS